MVQLHEMQSSLEYLQTTLKHLLIFNNSLPGSTSNQKKQYHAHYQAYQAFTANATLDLQTAAQFFHKATRYTNTDQVVINQRTLHKQFKQLHINILNAQQILSDCKESLKRLNESKQNYHFHESVLALDMHHQQPSDDMLEEAKSLLANQKQKRSSHNEVLRNDEKDILVWLQHSGECLCNLFFSLQSINRQIENLLQKISNAIKRQEARLLADIGELPNGEDKPGNIIKDPSSSSYNSLGMTTLPTESDSTGSDLMGSSIATPPPLPATLKEKNNVVDFDYSIDDAVFNSPDIKNVTVHGKKMHASIQKQIKTLTQEVIKSLPNTLQLEPSKDSTLYNSMRRNPIFQGNRLKVDQSQEIHQCHSKDSSQEFLILETLLSDSLLEQKTRCQRP